MATGTVRSAIPDDSWALVSLSLVSWLRG